MIVRSEYRPGGYVYYNMPDSAEENQMTIRQMFIDLARDDHRRVMEHQRKLRDAERAQARAWKRFHTDELFQARLQRSIHLDMARLS